MSISNYKQPYSFIEPDHEGIYHMPVKADGSDYLAPIRLSDTFEVIGRGTDNDGIHYHIIRFGDNETCIVPRGDVGTSEGWRHLRNFINIPSSRRKLDLLTEHIQAESSKPEVKAAEWKIADVAGWHGNVYILPNGEIIGDNNNRLYFGGKISYNKRVGYKEGGTLADWRSHIGRYAAGNSRMCLALGIAFAAPLLRLLNLSGSIFHLYGQSSSGKTTVQNVAQSVWGHGQDTSEVWNTTPYAVINNAAARNDGLLCLDEIGEDANGKAVDKGIYTLANGKGRAQGRTDGGNRAEIRFRTLTLSTGETTLEAHLTKHGKKTMAGQMVRCLSVPHRLEHHHDSPDFRHFTQRLNDAVCQYYGSPGREFIRRIQADNNLREHLAQRFAGHLDKLLREHMVNDQLARAARTFAATMTALELACEWGITGFGAAEGLSGINLCFADWLDAQPRSESYEAMQILQAATDYMQTREPHFLNPEDPPLYPSSQFPGYVKRGITSDDDLYYVIPQEFRDKIVQGFDEKKVKDVLHKAGWLVYEEKSARWATQLCGKDPATKQRKRLGYFLVFRGISPIESKDSQNALPTEDSQKKGFASSQPGVFVPA